MRRDADARHTAVAGDAGLAVGVGLLEQLLMVGIDVEMVPLQELTQAVIGDEPHGSAVVPQPERGRTDGRMPGGEGQQFGQELVGAGRRVEQPFALGAEQVDLL